ncbi:unnamed protein product [Amoebophrya sp. A120]|nr:unnamed protein product [Amoebophrya sp. A120]|eukprot:GSA120T00002737001.1
MMLDPENAHRVAIVSNDQFRDMFARPALSTDTRLYHIFQEAKSEASARRTAQTWLATNAELEVLLFDLRHEFEIDRFGEVEFSQINPSGNNLLKFFWSQRHVEQVKVATDRKKSDRILELETLLKYAKQEEEAAKMARQRIVDVLRHEVRRYDKQNGGSLAEEDGGMLSAGSAAAAAQPRQVVMSASVDADRRENDSSARLGSKDTTSTKSLGLQLPPFVPTTRLLSHESVSPVVDAGSNSPGPRAASSTHQPGGLTPPNGVFIQPPAQGSRSAFTLSAGPGSAKGSYGAKLSAPASVGVGTSSSAVAQSAASSATSARAPVVVLPDGAAAKGSASSSTSSTAKVNYNIFSTPAGPGAPRVLSTTSSLVPLSAARPKNSATSSLVPLSAARPKKGVGKQELDEEERRRAQELAPGTNGAGPSASSSSSASDSDDDDDVPRRPRPKNGLSDLRPASRGLHPRSSSSGNSSISSLGDGPGDDDPRPPRGGERARVLSNQTPAEANTCLVAGEVMTAKQMKKKMKKQGTDERGRRLGPAGETWDDEVCWDWKHTGRCKRGTKCKYAHPDLPGRA